MPDCLHPSRCWDRNWHGTAIGTGNFEGQTTYVSHRNWHGTAIGTGNFEGQSKLSGFPPNTGNFEGGGELFFSK